jgi:hypothetical protein
MEYFRKTVSSDTLAPIFDLPAGLRNRNVEVIILPADIGTGEKPRRKSAKGCLKKYADPALVSLEKGAWAKAAEGKYADR